MNELKFNDYMISFLPGLCYEVLCDEDNILEYFDVKKHQEKIQSFEHISIGGLISKSFSLWPKSPWNKVPNDYCQIFNKRASWVEFFIYYMKKCKQGGEGGVSKTKKSIIFWEGLLRIYEL